jgi:hypothetical protein
MIVGHHFHPRGNKVFFSLQTKGIVQFSHWFDAQAGCSTVGSLTGIISHDSKCLNLVLELLSLKQIASLNETKGTLCILFVTACPGDTSITRRDA